ncbi:unnamed protein product [Anisakis simplex]|uniref:Uncharacterized protein n=1 Tax=Anisakis simplex TaxID=6269 RepID=A0A3P6PGK5_ANISI|nr:unnamed protein product [Anisakis simplex]
MGSGFVDGNSIGHRASLTGYYGLVNVMGDESYRKWTNLH